MILKEISMAREMQYLEVCTDLERSCENCKQDARDNKEVIDK